MRARTRLALAALLLLPAAARGQDHSGAIGYGAGGAWFSAFNPGSDARSLGLDPGWVVSAHLDGWPGAGRLGWRVSGSYSNRPLDGLPEERDINVWMVDGSAVFRPLLSRRGSPWEPFVAAGVGVVNYDLGEGGRVLVPEAASAYEGDAERQIAGVGRVGVDLYPGWRWTDVPLGVRVEVTDYVTFESPFARMGGGGAFGAVHNALLTLGVHGLVW